MSIASEALVTIAREKLAAKAKLVLKQFNKVVCQFATGSGKSKVALDFSVETGENWHILVPRIPLFKTWSDEIDKWGYTSHKSKFTILCYKSAGKLPVEPTGRGINIILDEAHRVTESSIIAIKKALGTHGKLICLSATIPLKKRLILEQLGLQDAHYVKYSLDRSVKDNLVADYN